MEPSDVEGALQECHTLLNHSRSSIVRDHLHGLLRALLQHKQALLSGGIVTASAPNGAPQVSAMAPLGQTSSSGGGGIGSKIDASCVAADLARNLSLADSQQSSDTSSGARPGSQHDVGEQASEGTRSNSTGAATPIEPILASTTGLSPYDPVWQPGQKSSRNGFMDGVMPGFNTVAAGQTGLTAGRDVSSGAAESHLSHRGGLLDGFNVVPSQFMHEFPEALRQAQQQMPGLASSGGFAALQLQHTSGSGALPLHGRQLSWMQQPSQPPLQQQGSYPTLSAAFPGQAAMGGPPPPPPPPQAAKALLQPLPGSYGAGSPVFGSGGSGGYTGRLAQPNGGSGYGSGFGYAAGVGAFSGGQLHRGPYGTLGLGANANLGSAIASGVHPALQYGIDLRGGELDAMGLPLFRPLTTYSWEQSDGLVKIYVPLRGVQTDLLRATFTPTSVEVRVVALQGKNYVYAVKSLYLPIKSDGCHVAASKTKKNVLITLQKLRSETPDEKHWRDLTAM